MRRSLHRAIEDIEGTLSWQTPEVYTLAWQVYNHIGRCIRWPFRPVPLLSTVDVYIQTAICLLGSPEHLRLAYCTTDAAPLPCNAPPMPL